MRHYSLLAILSWLAQYYIIDIIIIAIITPLFTLLPLL